MSYEGPHPIKVAVGGTSVQSTTAYGVVCGGTSSTGAVQNAGAGTSGQVLKSNGSSSLPSYVATSTAGAWVLLSSQTASNSAAISFTSLLTATYDKYCLIWSNHLPINNAANLKLLVSVNNGLTYVTTAYNASILYAAVGSSSLNVLGTPNFVYLNESVSNTTLGGSGYLYMTSVSNGGAFRCWGQSTYYETTSTALNGGALYGINTNTVVNAIQVSQGTGNISTGTFSLYGILE